MRLHFPLPHTLQRYLTDAGFHSDPIENISKHLIVRRAVQCTYRVLQNSQHSDISGNLCGLEVNINET